MAKGLIEKDNEKQIHTVLEQDIQFSGSLKFSTSLKIKGKFTGDIDSKGHLYIGQDAVVTAKIKAKKITIYGKVAGNIEAYDKIELHSNAELTGDIKTPDLQIQNESLFNGKCIMVKKEPEEIIEEEKSETPENKEPEENRKK